jgi:hypothetical protein
MWPVDRYGGTLTAGPSLTPVSETISLEGSDSHVLENPARSTCENGDFQRAESVAVARRFDVGRPN